MQGLYYLPNCKKNSICREIYPACIMDNCLRITIKIRLGVYKRLLINLCHRNSNKKFTNTKRFSPLIPGVTSSEPHCKTCLSSVILTSLTICLQRVFNLTSIVLFHTSNVSAILLLSLKQYKCCRGLYFRHE